MANKVKLNFLYSKEDYKEILISVKEDFKKIKNYTIKKRIDEMKEDLDKYKQNPYMVEFVQTSINKLGKYKTDEEFREVGLKHNLEQQEYYKNIIKNL